MIRSFTIFSFCIPLSTHARKREGLLLRVEGQDLDHHWAEISPLPGWSKETLDQAGQQLETTCRQLITLPKTQALEFLLQTNKLYPSVSCGLFSAIYPLCFPLQKKQYDVSALLYGTYKEILSQVEDITKNGFTYVKLKTNQLNVSQAKQVVEMLSKEFKIRIDINRGWSSHDIENFFSSYDLTQFDYVEEPYKEADRLKLFAHPLAFDESLRESLYESKDLPLIPHAIVFKPMLMGIGPSSQKIINYALDNKLQISFSSSFESGIGLYQLSTFAQFFKIHKTTLGIDTYKFISEDTLNKRHTFTNGKVLFSPLDPNITKLKKVSSVY